MSLAMDDKGLTDESLSSGGTWLSWEFSMEPLMLILYLDFVVTDALEGCKNRTRSPYSCVEY